MHAEAPDERVLGQTGKVASFRGAFQTVQKNHLAQCVHFRLVLKSHYSITGVAAIEDPFGWKSRPIYLAGPEIPSDG